jgi:hypothetical protein
LAFFRFQVGAEKILALLTDECQRPEIMRLSGAECLHSPLEIRTRADKIISAGFTFGCRPDGSHRGENRKDRRTSMERRNFTTIIPSLVPETSDIALDRLLMPARHFRTPDDVLADPALDLQEKRAILSSWASDACAVESMPALRQPPGGSEPVSFDRIMDALRRLDEEPRPAAYDYCGHPSVDQLDV